MTNKIEEIFKSEDVCPDCGGVVMKATGAKKGKGAKKLGNEMHPHKGKARGQVDHPRGGMKGPAVQRDAVKPKNPTVEKAMFPVNSHYAATEYVGLEQDNVLAKSIESGSEALHVPPQRNLEMEKESADIRKAFPPKKDDDDESQDDENDSGESESESESSDDGESSET